MDEFVLEEELTGAWRYWETGRWTVVRAVNLVKVNLIGESQ